MNFHNICVYDFETDGTDPQVCNPIQLAAIMLDARTLNIIPKSEFSIRIKPDSSEENTYYEAHKNTLEWHAKNMRTTPDKVLAIIQGGVPEKLAWEQFATYVSKYHMPRDKKTMFTAPLQAGMNILRFDTIILERLQTKYNTSNLFYPRDRVDLLNMLFLWFEDRDDLKSYSMDELRPYFGLTTENSHDAIKDVQDTALLIARFLQLHRRYSQKIKFKGSLNA